MWLEVKGDEATVEEVDLCQRLANQTDYRCGLAKGPPDRDGNITIYWPNLPEEAFEPIRLNDGTYLEAVRWAGSDYRFAYDRRDEGVFWLQSYNHWFVVIGLEKASDHERPPLVFGPVEHGYLAAASARFEHGESG